MPVMVSLVRVSNILLLILLRPVCLLTLDALVALVLFLLFLSFSLILILYIGLTRKHIYIHVKFRQRVSHSRSVCMHVSQQSAAPARAYTRTARGTTPELGLV